MRTFTRFPDGHTENKILPLPSGSTDVKFLDESTRKRKLPVADQQEIFSEIGFKCSFSKKSNLLLPKSLHCVGSLPLNKMPVSEIVTIPYGPTQTHHLFSQAERLILPPVPDFFSAQAGESKANLGLQDMMSFGYKNYVVADNQSLKVRYSSGNLESSDLLHQGFVGPNELPVTLDGKACLLENGQTLQTAGSFVATTSLEHCTCTESTENDRSLQNEIAVGNGTVGLCLGDELREDDQGCGDANHQMMNKTRGSNSNSSLVRRISFNDGDNLAGAVSENDQRSRNGFASSKSSYEKSISLAGKLATTTSEKLWDGSLRLNSSVTVSTVAFFKSGEKMLDVKWSDIAEVKGKVRLEAFERYIQDLSRSRNRGLMVISLCWKEGSSKSGLLGMKKVAKGYREEGRVGFVKLSPGIDLYVCPCSDTIITILAKCGFFKGMAAVLDNKDSLIGCVVWRKHGAYIGSATKKSDGKNCSLSEHPYKSFSGSSNRNSAEKKLSCIQPVQESVQVAPETESSTLKRAGNSKIESKLLKSSEVQLGLRNSCANTDIPITSVLIPETLTGSNCATDSASLKGSVSQLSDVEAPRIHKLSMERPELSLELQKSVLSLPSDVTRKLDDDDLPEFDFKTACVLSQTSMSGLLDASTIDKKLLTKGLREMVGSTQPTMPKVRSLSTFNKQRSEIPFPLDDVQRIPLLTKVYTHEESQTTQSKSIMIPVNATAVTSKNLFHGDGDDMPEWCPPYAEPFKLLLPRITPSPTACAPSKLCNSTFESSCSRPSPLQVAHPPFSTYAFPCENHCSIDASTNMAQPRPPAKYVRRVASSSVVFNANPFLRPPPNTFAVKLPIHPAGWRGWRP